MSAQGSNRKRMKYTAEQMQLAIEMVRTGNMSKKEAALTYGVPRSTLIDKLSGRVPEVGKPGPDTVLSAAEERALVGYLKLMAEIQYPLTRAEFLFQVKKVLDIDGRKTSFTNNLPSKGWFYLFCKRHPEITERVPQLLARERASISFEMLQGWYKGLSSFLEKVVPDFQSLINDPRRIFNADESGFPLCVTSNQVLTSVSSHHMYEVVSNAECQITVTACFNALGDYSPPLIVFPGQTFRNIGLSDFPEAIYGHTDDGWMDSDLFFEFLKHFVKFVEEKHIQFPVILFVDGHSTHISLATAEFCAANGVILYCLLPNATRILQACHIGLFSPMKASWEKCVKEWQTQHVDEVFTKTHFPSVFKKAWYSVTTLENSVNGFKRSGLFPLSIDGIDVSKLGPSKVACPATEVPTQSSTALVPGSDEQVVNEDPADDTTTNMLTTPEARSETENSSALNTNMIQVTAEIHPAPPSAMASPAFECLDIPKMENTLQKKMAKALSASEALAILREREEQKVQEEQEKTRTKQRQEQMMMKKKEERKRKKRAKQSSDEDDEEIVYMDSDDDEEEIVSMDTDDGEVEDDEEWAGCGTPGGKASDWVAMQQCEPPQQQQQQREENRKLEARVSTEAETGDSKASDAYECRICGYKASDVCSLSQHLHSVHPVTALPGPSSAKDEESKGADEVETRDQTSEGQKSPPAGNSEFSEGSMSSSPMDSEETSISTCNAENQVPAAEQKETVKNTPAAKDSQSISPASILPQRKASSSPESIKGSQSEDAASSGTSSLNQTHLVCLPLVSEGLKLVWVRSEQIKELDAVSELVEAFNAFPYPTEQEASALARRCSLSPERVKVWFMMQRVRYGISWADDDIRQTRLKLRRLQRLSLGEEGEEEEEDYLAHEERTPETLQQSVKQAPVTDVYTGYIHYTPQPVFSQGATNDYNSRQNSIIPQYSNGFETFVQQQTENQYVSEFQNASVDKDHAQLPRDLNHLPPHEPKAESSTTYHNLSKSAVICGPPITQQRKKTKAQLMALRRSFVQKNWPSEAEVQRLQRATGLGRHEIRKWFADSRYQLRRSGRSWLAELTKPSQSPEPSGRFRQQLNNDEFQEDGEASGTTFDYELDVDMEDQQGPVEDGVGKSDTRKAKQSEEPPQKDSQANVKQERREIAIVPSPSPASSSPSPSLLQGWNPSLGPEPNLRKKTWEQLNMLRQSFLHCQWPTSEDYTILQQKTGLTRTEIVQWYGDTRYHIKHSNLRWIHPDDRERVRAGVMKQQKRAGKGPRSRRWTEGTDPSFKFREPQSSNGTGRSEAKSWDKLFKTASSVLPSGEL
ncbi:homeobox and leucine zipper encoding b isoform X2 [Neoarius graeffei]|uniref:homeobox and leucine zipper encoding b isoform X2 n=1 Tax=Neoarius graeffei TaxID=443677 RepID=UPI00298C4F2A|nr:homeobox and leucine zipper encoding b isoform X2 [Neoarius graeffei]